MTSAKKLMKRINKCEREMIKISGSGSFSRMVLEEESQRLLVQLEDAHRLIEEQSEELERKDRMIESIRSDVSVLVREIDNLRKQLIG